LLRLSEKSAACENTLGNVRKVCTFSISALLL